MYTVDSSGTVWGSGPLWDHGTCSSGKPMESGWESPIFFLWISIKQKHRLRECTQLKEKVRILLNENRKLLVEQAGTQVSHGEEKRFCEEASKNICASSAKEQQVG